MKRGVEELKVDGVSSAIFWSYVSYLLSFLLRGVADSQRQHRRSNRSIARTPEHREQRSHREHRVANEHYERPRTGGVNTNT
jgi:hypothetical protein